MNEDTSHLLPGFRHYALLSAVERIAWIRQDRWIGYRRAEQILVAGNHGSDPPSCCMRMSGWFRGAGSKTSFRLTLVVLTSGSLLRTPIECVGFPGQVIQSIAR